jgi:hypothetical protein
LNIPGWFSRTMYDAENFGNACHRWDGANVDDASYRTAAVTKSLFRQSTSCWA